MTASDAPGAENTVRGGSGAAWAARLVFALRMPGQYGALMPWVPVCLAAGIGLYFALPAEPAAWHWRGAALALALSASGLAAGARHWPPAVAFALILAGLCLGGARSAIVAAPVLDFRYYGAVEGRIVTIDRSASDKTRLTLDRVRLDRVEPARTPDRVRLSLHGDQRWLDPRPGQTVILTGHLAAPEGPVEPGGFDFRRHAWFKGIGAVGYTRTPALLLDDARGRWLGRLRLHLAGAIRARLPGETGAVAAALATGDRSGLDAGTVEALRATNLAHLLAISGLHMGLLTGAVFFALRLAMACLPALALGRPIKKWAALGALGAGAFYLALSGGNVATQRAFIMAAIFLGAILMDRRAITLRGVAVAATLVLLIRPEALTGPGFQMSFAATTALVAVFRLLRDREGAGLPRWLRPVAAVVISSAVAGAATAPVGAAHFNTLSQYGLLANVLSVPVMGLLVMPGAVAAAVLAPLGLAEIGLWAMALGIDWILGVAHWVAGFEGTVIPVPAPPGAVLPLMAAGGVFVVLWQGRVRWAGLAPVVAALALWSGVERPAVLVAPPGGLVGAMTDGGRALSKPSGAGFAARVWLENDGDLATQDAAAARADWPMRLGDRALHHVWGRGGAERAAELCQPGAIVVTTAEIADPGTCLFFGPERLSRTGAVALSVGPGGVTVRTAREVGGARPWTGQ